ncbi:MAG: hypothetical protein PF961_14085 [Planctomycetota bacterium]|jgi:hypothetical protein|nr:hypothetical protein [Planctomycetota bacterium]
MAYHDDVDIYEQVARELESGDLIKGLWLKCLSDSGGDKQLAEAVYVKARAFQLKEEAEAEAERDRKERESASEHMSNVDRDRMHADALADLGEGERKWFEHFRRCQNPPDECVRRAKTYWKERGDYDSSIRKNDIIVMAAIVGIIIFFILILAFAQTRLS